MYAETASYKSLTDGIHLNAELSKMLQEDRCRNLHYHITTDKVMKSFLLEMKGFAPVMRT